MRLLRTDLTYANSLSGPTNLSLRAKHQNGTNRVPCLVVLLCSCCTNANTVNLLFPEKGPYVVTSFNRACF